MCSTVISATDSKQLKLGQPCPKCTSCYSVFHKDLSLAPILFSLYTTPLSKVIGKDSNIKFYFHADDTQLFVHMCHKNVALAFDELHSCLQVVQEWMLSSMLKIEP